MRNLTITQLGFLEIAKSIKEDYNGGLGDGWFNRRDVFCGKLNYMPYTVGLSLYEKGLLETDPPNHPSGFDLNFRITTLGEFTLATHRKVVI